MPSLIAFTAVYADFTDLDMLLRFQTPMLPTPRAGNEGRAGPVTNTQTRLSSRKQIHDLDLEFAIFFLMNKCSRGLHIIYSLVCVKSNLHGRAPQNQKFQPLGLKLKYWNEIAEFKGRWVPSNKLSYETNLTRSRFHVNRIIVNSFHARQDFCSLIVSAPYI